MSKDSFLNRTTFDRRRLLRAGLALPALGAALGACSTFRDQEATPAPPGPVPPVGSDASMHGTGGQGPDLTQVKPFHVYDPFLPAVQPGPKIVDVTAEDVTVYIAKDVPFTGWTFGGTIPAPVIRVVEGDTLDVTFRVDPNASVAHSLDFHSARTPPNVNYRTISPGEELSYTFVPKYPGAFMYHCGTPPVLMHIGAGMYGAMIVDPKEGWPPARELVFVQSEFYVDEAEGGVMMPSMRKMLGTGDMDFVAFNGYANQYVENPIRVKVGEPIRIFVVNAGPNIWASFHVVGAIFDAAYPNANPQNKLVGQQSISIGPGDGACVEFVLEEPGEYTAVNHSFGHAAHGAVGVLIAE